MRKVKKTRSLEDQPKINPDWQPLLKRSSFSFPWKKFLIAIIIIGIVVGSGIFTTTYAYPVIKKNVVCAMRFNSGKYLILFQNNNELRASGGFIGSFAVIETNSGKVKNISFDTNIYKRDWQFTQTNDVEPPGVLKNFCPDGKWQMRDSNWAVDYPEAAQKVAWFYQQEGGTPVDGVIAIDATFFEEILKIIGPIKLPEYNTTITSEDFFPDIQYKIEKEYYSDPRNIAIYEPKSILKDLAKNILPAFENKKNYYPMIKSIYSNLAHKHIMLYFSNKNAQDFALEKNWAGQIITTEGQDYLHINYSNLGANKSSLKVEEEVRVQTNKQNGALVDNVRIIRTHKGTNDWPDGENRSYARILVPQGTKILSIAVDGQDVLKDIEVSNVNNKTQFAFWIKIKPGTSKITEISYQLPENIDQNNYSLYWQKQAGTLGDQLELEFSGQKLFSGYVSEDKLISL
ncbi:MAG: DUF4012 domain-containing protein [Patescibacteria group bacterium]|nr:DUF4012 domain-containing protein [Patescibacteria group bacterium]